MCRGEQPLSSPAILVCRNSVSFIAHSAATWFHLWLWRGVGPNRKTARERGYERVYRLFQLFHYWQKFHNLNMLQRFDKIHCKLLNNNLQAD